MKNYVVVMQNNLKKSSSGLFVLILKLISALIFGLTFSLIGEHAFGYKQMGFSFVFVLVVFSSVYLAITRKFGIVGVGIFNLFFVLVGLLLRMYAIVAPDRGL